ncbi:MAG: DNA -binding domain-containing protein [Alphaproteobacteria bacterium]
MGVIREGRDSEVADRVPWSERVTPYDEAHFVTYLRLLDATADGASEDEMSRVVLGIDPDREPERARTALKSHLERARWMTKTGYRDLLAK